MTYLADADVLSEATKPSPDGRVVDWLRANEGRLVVDAVILGELSVGVLSLPRGRKRRQLEQWFESLVRTIDCLAWDGAVARRWARLVVDLKREGMTMPLLDGMIAATALHHDLVMATRNTHDFAKAGVRTLNPFE